MQKVIGLDIGSFSIKAIEIINTFKSYEIVKFYETVVPNLDAVPLDAVVPVCMEQLFRENDIVADRIITAMPGQFISSRILPFNFSDPRKIEASIGIELEDHVPFNMDDMIVDHQILGPLRDKTMVLAVMTRKAFLKNFLDLLGRIDIDPKLVDIDSLAFYNLSSHLDLVAEGSYALVDVGHEKTSVCIIRDGVLRMFRSINLGGRYITEFLSRDLECSFMEAQRTKHSISAVVTRDHRCMDLAESERAIAERITVSTNAIVKELGRTIYAYKSYEKAPLGQIYLTGGTSKIRNFEHLLSEQLEIQVAKLDLRHTALKVSDEVADRMECVPQSLAIGLRAVTNVKKHSQINLRRGEFAYVQNYESFLRGAANTFKVICVALLLLVISYFLKLGFYQNQIEKLQKAYTSVYKESFPKSSTAKMDFATLRKKASNDFRLAIAEANGAVTEYQVANSHSPSLEILKDMSEKIAKDVVVDVTEYDFKTLFPGQGKLVFKAETAGFEEQSKIIEALKSIKTLTNVQEGKSSSTLGTETKKITFSISAIYDVAGRANEAETEEVK